MSDITPIGQPQPTALDPTKACGAGVEQPTTTSRPRDRVELSVTAQMLSKIHDLPDVRRQLIDRVRADIHDPNYETEAKIDLTAQAMAEDLAIE